MKKQINRPLILAAIILAVGIFRIATVQTHSSLSGFTPLGAMSLFAGFYFNDKWKAYLLPLLTLWLSDIILNRYLYFNSWVFFYDSFAWVYASFVLMVLIGQLVKTVSVKTVLVSSMAAAFGHLLLSNFGVWLIGCTGTAEDIVYSPDVSGLLNCYYMAVPSMLNMLIGNLIFGALLFGSFEWIQKRFPVLQLQHV
jgi:hypothetical protein